MEKSFRIASGEVWRRAEFNWSLSMKARLLRSGFSKFSWGEKASTSVRSYQQEKAGAARKQKDRKETPNSRNLEFFAMAQPGAVGCGTFRTGRFQCRPVVSNGP